MFIHRCYTECGKDAHNNPYLFFHDIEPMDYKRNQIVVQTKIQEGITRAVRKILPISMILKEYLINSMNIVQEQPKVELLGLVPTNQIENIMPNDIYNKQPNIDQRIVSDSNLEKEVLRIINTESNKSDKQKIQAIMNIDKIISSREPTRPMDMSVNNMSGKKELSTITKRVSDYLVAPLLMEDEYNHSGNNIFNNHLRHADREILNINIDDEKTEGASITKKSVSATTLSGRGMPRTKISSKRDPESSERVDPSKIKLIEDYGSNFVANKRKMQKPSKKVYDV